MRKTSLFLLAACMAALLFTAVPARAGEPSFYTLGNTRLRAAGPADHAWMNKKSVTGLQLAPERYKPLVKQVLSLYSLGSFTSLTKPYNNHAALFFIGPPEKLWTEKEFSELKARLMPGTAPTDEAALLEREQFLRSFLADNVGFAIPKRKAKKYYERLQSAKVLREEADSVILVLRHKKKGERDKYVTASITLLQGKLVGTAYYQVSPSKQERERAANITMAWQRSLLGANS